MLSVATVWALALSTLGAARPCLASASDSDADAPCIADSLMTVNTTNGPITGHIATNTSCVVEYLGIPYAKPPVGDLRFAAPERFTADTAYTASDFGSDCPLTASKAVAYPNLTAQAQRVIDYFASSAGTPQSEDCLTLNVWTSPTGNSSHGNKPVWVFFYGGRFTIGNTDSPFYNGKYFADAEDIVVVTVNYRTNIFGFAGAPAGASSVQNAGLRDQRAAVEWVRDNVAAFGGNASRITIDGQSSGGASVDYWAYAHETDPIAQALIAQSGNAFSFPTNTQAVQEANWAAVVDAVNCTSDSDADAMACMRTVDWTSLKTAAAAVKSTKSTSVLRGIPPFWPKVDNVTVFADYEARTAAGRFAKIPILYGNNDNENGYYQIPAYAQGVVPTAAQVDAFLLESFTCPVAYQANARRAHGVPSYAYRYFADWDNTRLYPTSGAYHGVDLHMLFGASADVSGLPTSADQRELTSVMQKAYASFISDPWHGLDSVGWPTFNPDTESLIQLGLNNTPRAQFTYPSVYDAPCSTVTMGALGTASATATAA